MPIVAVVNAVTVASHEANKLACYNAKQTCVIAPARTPI